MLLGREREQRELARLLEEARAGHSGVLVLVGEPGIGKSALLDNAAALAAGTRVLRGRGVASESQIPFAVLFQLLRPALSYLDRIPQPQAAALESALALRPAQAEDRFAIGAATLSLLAAYADEQPVVVLVDDAHWLDGSSAAAILFAVRRLLAEPIAAVVTARAGEASSFEGAGLPLLRVSGLDAGAAELLLRQSAPGMPAAVAARLYRETGGNPLALIELAEEPLPDLAPDTPLPTATSVADAYVQRVELLPSRTQRALLLASATDHAELALLGRAGVRLGVDFADLDSAEGAGLIAMRDGQLEFRHPLVRSAIYAAAAPERRREVHRALAETLPDADTDRRAWHLALAAAGPDEIASSALAQAAKRAHARSAYDVSSHAFERAARLATDNARYGELLYEAAEGAWLAGLAERALLLLDESQHTVDGAPLVHQIEHLRGHIAILRGPLREGAARLREAAERADPATAVVMLAEVVVGAFYGADATMMRECADQARTLAAREGSTRSAFFSRIAGGMALVMVGQGDLGAAEIREAVEILERSDELRDDPRLLAFASMGPLWLREVGVGQELVDRAVAAARARSAVGVLPHLLTHVAIQDAASNRWVEAQAGFDEAIRLARETGQRIVLAGALARFAWLEARLGREGACRAHAADALTLARELEAGLPEIWALAALCELELALGNAAEALAHAEERHELMRRREIADPDLSPAPEQVELYLRIGRADAAAAVRDAFEQAAAAKGQPWALARAARVSALLASDNDFHSIFEAALEIHERTPDVFERARTELAYGARLRRSGRRMDAREHLRTALDEFESLGAAPWAEAARAELAATGERARRRDPSSLDELTPQELQISLLLAEGRTTREAAAALFLSPKTIEYHLQNVYRKLAVHSRDELRRALQASRT